MQDGIFRRAKPQLRKKRTSSSDEEAEAKKPETKKPAIPKGLQIGAVGTIKTDKKLSKGLSFGDGDEDESGEFSKKKSAKPKPEAVSKGAAHTFSKSSGQPSAPIVRGSYYTNTSYSNDELAALTKNAKSLGAGTVIRLPTNPAGIVHLESDLKITAIF
jgi:hypothetical protein